MKGKKDTHGWHDRFLSIRRERSRDFIFSIRSVVLFAAQRPNQPGWSYFINPQQSPSNKYLATINTSEQSHECDFPSPSFPVLSSVFLNPIDALPHRFRAISMASTRLHTAIPRISSRLSHRTSQCPSFRRPYARKLSTASYSNSGRYAYSTPILGIALGIIGATGALWNSVDVSFLSL